jgi:hypothetical protein
MDVRSSHIGYLLVALLLVFSPACDVFKYEERWEGIYEAQAEEDSKYAGATIELKEDGEGTWIMLDDEAPFSWYKKGDQLRLNTKGGGVIVGEIQDEDSFEIQLPGAERMSFKKSD